MPIKCTKLFQIYVLKKFSEDKKNPAVHDRRLCAQHHSCFLRNKESHGAQR